MYRGWDGKHNVRDGNQKSRVLDDWLALCPGLDKESIEDVVYSWDAGKLRAMMEKGNPNAGNRFAQWVNTNQDTEMADYLVLMRECEQACADRADVWYYPFKDDPDINMLRSVISRAEGYKGSRLQGRYVLQAVRAMFSLNDYNAIRELWNKKGKALPDGIIKEMIEGYVAGAEFRNGDMDRCLDYYIREQDFVSVQYCLRKMGRDCSDKVILSVIAENCPDCPETPEILHRVLYGCEDCCSHYQGRALWQNLDYKERMTIKRGDPARNDEYLKICMTAITRSESPAIWYYSAAFLSDLNCRPEIASRFLESAERTNTDAFLGESIKVMRIYLDSKLSEYDREYEQKLYGQLKWLDGKIVAEINDNVRKATEEGYQMRIGVSFYYWNDMMRKIVIGEVCPRMEDAGKGVLALRLMNMADNRLRTLVNRVSVGKYERSGDELKYVQKTISLNEYRASEEYENNDDFSNYYFNCMDAIDLKYLRKYASSAGNASTEFERFLDDRGYINRDAINDVIGTRYIRAQQYSRAVQWLSKVPEKYHRTTNVHWYMRMDPFEYRAARGALRNNYKLSFAREMDDLEQRMKSEDPDVRGIALVKYGTGLRSSFTNCWALTQYHKYSDDAWLKDTYTQATISKAEAMIDEGLCTIRDPEMAAEAYFGQAFYISAAKKFPSSQFMKGRITQCPGLKEYMCPGGTIQH